MTMFAGALRLRPVEPEDVDAIYEHQLDPEGRRMAAFVSAEPDRAEHDAHWARIMQKDSIRIRTIVVGDDVVGHVAAFDRGDEREVTYWIAREYWGQGVATAALAVFLQVEAGRPIHARVASDNAASRRVLEKCGFVLERTERAFAEGRGEEIEELVMQLG